MIDLFHPYKYLLKRLAFRIDSHGGISCVKATILEFGACERTVISYLQLRGGYDFNNHYIRNDEFSIYMNIFSAKNAHDMPAFTNLVENVYEMLARESSTVVLRTLDSLEFKIDLETRAELTCYSRYKRFCFQSFRPVKNEPESTPVSTACRTYKFCHEYAEGGFRVLNEQEI